MAKEHDAGDQIAAWVHPMKVQDVVSERAKVLLEAMHVNVRHKAEVAHSLPPQLFGGSFLSSVAAAAHGDGDVASASVMPPLPGFATAMDMEEMEMAIPRPPGFDDEMGMAVKQLLMVMPPSPEIPAGLETNAGFLFPY
ncbi:uncharacterized protein [Aegilops tauschii subsp. strangulata]|uniref:uncharacterized protein n=1 Tax=Aegilops tauschii subsp. strangulata TaxID=200361 RepID=UPI003CC888F2